MGALSLQVPIGELVWDLSSGSFPGGRLPLEFVFVRGAGVSQDSAITKGLQNVVMLWGGHVLPQKKAGFTGSPLLSSARPTKAQDSSGANGIDRKSDVFQMDFPWSGGPQINQHPQRVRRNDDLI